MKQTLLIILLCLACISASVVSTKTISTPAIPSHTATYITDGQRSLIDMKAWIDDMRGKGFIVKSVSFAIGSVSAGGIVVMEKY